MHFAHTMRDIRGYTPERCPFWRTLLMREWESMAAVGW